MYLEMATEEDKEMAEGWGADVDGILIFTGLFSAAVASSNPVAIQDIRPNTTGHFQFLPRKYLQYHTLANSGFDISTALPASPPPFSSPNYAVWVNTLFFLNLVVSIGCALLPTFIAGVAHCCWNTICHISGPSNVDHFYVPLFFVPLKIIAN
ncbi:hypothetical protein EDB86DRAFT_1315117 [Lactarius hatsudake]|nr:hypothetical protein EDB86DRAFT_1315117 [Lactarius hatsudake]